MEMDQLDNTSDEKGKSLKACNLSIYDEAFLAYSADMKRVNEKIYIDCERFIQDYEDSCSQMDALTKSLQQREYELNKKELKLQKEKTKLDLKKTVGERLSFCKQLVNESYSVRIVAEGLKSELEALNKRRAELEDQLKPESYETLQSEIMELETDLQVIHDDDCIDLQEKTKNLKSELTQKDEQLQYMEDQEIAFRSALKRKNNELQQARWELIDGLMSYTISGEIGVKRMGLVDSTPFNIKKSKQNAAKFESICRHLVEDPDWHPFTNITVGSEVIDEEDEKMVILKAECSEEQYEAVVTALIERNWYRQSGRDLMQELWNYNENREASFREGIDYMIKEWKILKQRKR